jgi:hypothetical protein
VIPDIVSSLSFPTYCQNPTTEDAEKLSDFRELKKFFFPPLYVLYIIHLIPSFRQTPWKLINKPSFLSKAPK